MKAHITKRPPIALGYRLPQGTAGALADAGFAVKELSDADLSCRLAALAGGTAAAQPPADGPLPQEPLLVLGECTDAQLDTALAALRRAGAVIPLKAVLTETNRAWTVLELWEELRREREAVAQKRKEQA